MNLIVIVLDSFRQDHVSTYHKGTPAFEGIASCQTPNIDQFAEECVVFENAYPEALPTIPIRTQLMTGQRTLPYRPWQPLTPEDVAIAQILSQEGYVSGLISDTYHYRAPRMNFHRDFHAYRWIRGQEYDPYVSAPLKRNLNDYLNENFPEQWRNRISQFLANTDQFAGPEDWFAHKVVDEAVEWLEDNRPHEKLFLWIDSFDPHEPWDPPDPWDTYTDSDYSGPRIVMPMGGMASDWASDAEIKHIQGLYAGEAAFVDHCLGRLFDQLKQLGYYDDSLIFLLADHGHPLGDHGSSSRARIGCTMNCSRSPLWCVYRRAKGRVELMQSYNSKISFRQCLKHSDWGITSHQCTVTASSMSSRGVATHIVIQLSRDTMRGRIGVFGMPHGAISSVLKANLTSYTT